MGSSGLRQEMKATILSEKITKTLCGDGYQRVLLAGEVGIGKTWLARMVSEHATKEGLCYFTLWLHLNKRFDDELSLYENIAFQIEVYDRDDKEGKQAEDLLTDLKEKITAELSRKKTSAEEKMKMLAQGEKKHTASAVMVPYLLLILDDEGHKTCEDTVMKVLSLENFLTDYTPLKILVTKRVGETESHDTAKPRITESDDKIEPYATQEPRNETTLESLVNDEARGLLESLERSWKIENPLIPQVVQKSNSLPAAVAVFARSLNCIKNLSPKQEKVLKEVLLPSGLTHSDSGSERSIKSCRYNPILHLSYQLLETDDTLKSATIDCFWHSLDFFKHCGCVYYRDLITQWILEGYFDPVRSVKKAYKDGYDILLELINRGILKTQEGDMVVPEMAMSNLLDLRHHGLLGRSRL